MTTKLFITGLAILAATTIMNAQQGGGKHCSGMKNCRGNGTAFVDKNSNGVCDNTENRKNSNSMNYKNGSGKKSQDKSRGNSRKNYTDANKNNVCDNFEARTKK